MQDGCPSCPAAIALLEQVAEHFEVDARVIDLDRSSEERPDAVFAVPTLTLDGRVVSLGTPSWDEIARLLSGPVRGDG